MSGGHTAGPWSLCQHLKGMVEDQSCKCGYRGVIFGPEHDVAMAICQPGHDRPVREEEWGTEPARYPREVELANARLISAAPDLLAALEGLTERMVKGDSISFARIEAAVAALAKARGEA